jgi:hypothetical protein
MAVEMKRTAYVLEKLRGSIVSQERGKMKRTKAIIHHSA